MAKKTGNRKKIKHETTNVPQPKETKDKMITDKISSSGEPR